MRVPGFGEARGCETEAARMHAHLAAKSMQPAIDSEDTKDLRPRMALDRMTHKVKDRVHVWWVRAGVGSSGATQGRQAHSLKAHLLEPLDLSGLKRQHAYLCDHARLAQVHL